MWIYHRFTLSFRDVEDLLTERCITDWGHGWGQVCQSITVRDRIGCVFAGLPLRHEATRDRIEKRDAAVAEAYKSGAQSYRQIDEFFESLRSKARLIVRRKMVT